MNYMYIYYILIFNISKNNFLIFRRESFNSFVLHIGYKFKNLC